MNYEIEKSKPKIDLNAPNGFVYVMFSYAIQDKPNDHMITFKFEIPIEYKNNIPIPDLIETARIKLKTFLSSDFPL